MGVAVQFRRREVVGEEREEVVVLHYVVVWSLVRDLHVQLLVSDVDYFAWHLGPDHYEVLRVVDQWPPVCFSKLVELLCKSKVVESELEHLYLAIKCPPRAHETVAKLHRPLDVVLSDHHLSLPFGLEESEGPQNAERVGLLGIDVHSLWKVNRFVPIIFPLLLAIRVMLIVEPEMAASNLVYGLKNNPWSELVLHMSFSCL